MKYYKEFMSRQEISDEGHQRLLGLGEGRKQPVIREKSATAYESKRPHPGWTWAASIAAVLALVAGIAIWQLSPKVSGPVAENPNPGVASASNVPQTAALTTAPVQDPVDDETNVKTNVPADDDTTTFQAKEPDLQGRDAVPLVWSMDYADLTGDYPPAASILLPWGSFEVDLTKEDIQTLFWGEGGKPTAYGPNSGDFPHGLYAWAGYDISASVIYDEDGKLWQLTVQGIRGEDSFVLHAAPGRLPPTCIKEDGGAETEVNGVTVTAWRREDDQDGDGITEHTCTSEFMLEDVGVRFENTGAGSLKANTDEKEYSGDAILFNELVVTQLVKEGLYLDHIAQTEDIPDWRVEQFQTLDDALNETDFAPYLPTTAPEGFGEFSGSLSYQEGTRNVLAARWYKNYDSVAITVHLPLASNYNSAAATHHQCDPLFEEDIVDVNVPESYDWRLYDGAICDVVPEKYQDAFYKPVFRAEDMSLEVVKARMNQTDIVINDNKYATYSFGCHFYVLHDNGVAVGYDCSGVTPEYVWSLVEDTLPEETPAASTIPTIQSRPIITHHPEPETHHSGHHH